MPALVAAVAVAPLQTVALNIIITTSVSSSLGPVQVHRLLCHTLAGAIHCSRPCICQSCRILRSIQLPQVSSEAQILVGCSCQALGGYHITCLSPRSCDCQAGRDWPLPGWDRCFLCFAGATKQLPTAEEPNLSQRQPQTFDLTLSFARNRTKQQTSDNQARPGALHGRDVSLQPTLPHRRTSP